MDYKPIKKGSIAEMPVRPNLADYDKARNEFRWDDIRGELDWFENGGINIAHQAVDRHAQTPLKDKAALYWEGKGG